MTTSNNLTLCQNNLLTEWAQNGRLFVNYTKERKGWEAGWTVLYMVYNVNSVTQSCYRTFNEFGVGVYEQVIAEDPSTLIDNFIYSFGDIYDSLRDVLILLAGNSRGQSNLPYEAGFGLGNALYLVISPTRP
jgi:hypothetical protein